MKKNPYRPFFGEEPIQVIPRNTEITNIIEDITSDQPERKSTLIIGVRGSGKTVLMNEVAETLQENPKWIVIRLNPERNILDDLMHKMASNKHMYEALHISKINLSFFGIGVELSDAPQITNVEVAIQEMLNWMKKKKMRLLVCIDEISNRPQVREFLSSYQIFLGEGLPVFLLCTGLYENIEKLKNEEHMTFLYRMPRIEPKALSVSAMARNYVDNLEISADTAYKMARMTKGYSFGFQALGYFCFQDVAENKSLNIDRVIPLFREKLETDAYEKIWSDMSEKDRELAAAISKAKNGKISEMIEATGWDSNYLNQYRKRLVRCGVASVQTRGYLEFSLPYFTEFLRENIGIEADGEES